jgi:hypothetical protein
MPNMQCKIAQYNKQLPGLGTAQQMQVDTRGGAIYDASNWQ